MLDRNRFMRNVKPNEEQLRRIMVRRMKRELPPRWDGTPAFPVRSTGSLEVDHSSAEREAHRLLTEYATTRHDAARRQSGDAGAAAANFVIMLLKKRLFSSPKAFAETIETHLATMTARSESVEAAAHASAKTDWRVLRPLV
jgi:hypothetical protein